MFSQSGCGPKRGIFAQHTPVQDVFSYLWTGCTEHIVETMWERGEYEWGVEEVNLMLASHLVMGLAPQATISDYFVHDTGGIFGNSWMKSRFTEHLWSDLHSAIHFDSNSLMTLVRDNSQSAWNLHQQLVVDEMMIPFTGRWKHIQHVKGKPHNTRLSQFLT
jgi:hypothetical protein